MKIDERKSFVTVFVERRSSCFRAGIVLADCERVSNESVFVIDDHAATLELMHAHEVARTAREAAQTPGKPGVRSTLSERTVMNQPVSEQ